MVLGLGGVEVLAGVEALAGVDGLAGVELTAGPFNFSVSESDRLTSFPAFLKCTIACVTFASVDNTRSLNSLDSPAWSSVALINISPGIFLTLFPWHPAGQ